MTPRIYADKVKLIVLYWSDKSRNVFFIGDKEMDSFIKWKQNKEPELTFKYKIMSVTDYENKHCILTSTLAPTE
jgi:hypothetical protein